MVDTHLNLALLATCCLVVAFPNTTSDMLPKLPALEFMHAFHRADGNLLLRGCNVGEGLASVEILGRLVPYTLVLLQRRCRAGRGEKCLERMGATGEVALALVLDLDRRDERHRGGQDEHWSRRTVDSQPEEL